MTTDVMRHWLVRGLVVATAVVTALSAQSGAPPARLSVQDAVVHYARGDFERAVRDLDTERLYVAPFTRALDQWIAEGDQSADPRRRTVAVAFAIEAVWAATRTVWNERELNLDSWKRITPDDSERRLMTSADAQGRVVSWAVDNLPKTGPLQSLERTLWLAALGVAEDGRAWHRVHHDIVPHALERLPAEPRLRLADVLARTNRALGALRQGQFSNRRHDVLRHEPSSGGIADAITMFEPLLADPALAGEVELRIGYLELRRDKWPSAIARFDAAREKTTEPALRVAADYFGGWVYEQQHRPDDAIVAYRRALAIAPETRNLSVRLSALLYLRNEREEAYRILDRGVNVRPVPVDPLVMLERADARFVRDWFASIRRALQ